MITQKVTLNFHFLNWIVKPIFVKNHKSEANIVVTRFSFLFVTYENARVEKSK